LALFICQLGYLDLLLLRPVVFNAAIAVCESGRRTGQAERWQSAFGVASHKSVF
jgi:hypothetical protein